MKNSLKFLVCPVCKSKLQQSNTKELKCIECSRKYDIKSQIPILLPPNLEEFKVLEAEYHDHEAHHYGEINMVNSFHVTYYHQKYLKIINELKDKSVVLEVGSGDGNDAKYITKPGITIIQSDISFQMVNLAKNNKKYNPNNIYVVSDAETIPCIDNSLDVIMIVGALHHLPSPINFFKEAQRALNSNGILIIGFEPNSWPYFYIYPCIRFIKKILRLEKYTSSKHSDVSIGDSETEGFTYSNFKSFLKESNLELEQIQRIWFLFGFIHTILSIINSKLPKDKSIDLPIRVQKIIIFIDELILSIPIIRNFCWHWTLVAKKK
ncbi:methyltransferase domain-containing protein [Methylophilaceae bacterium]|nr:methyltransferase domain-containing protein [Methylophilaceae bacterium]|tara:strand:- start:1375 stop:2340 length:966 start_codon:yes stop_codon:yes gene_type:complete